MQSDNEYIDACKPKGRHLRVLQDDWDIRSQVTEI
jgi:hypothetical protein